jgi:hypothetical protein
MLISLMNCFSISVTMVVKCTNRQVSLLAALHISRHSCHLSVVCGDNIGITKTLLEMQNLRPVSPPESQATW